MKARLIFAVLAILFIRPRLLEIIAIWLRLSRAIAARAVLDLWLHSSRFTGRVTRPLHRWLRSEANGRTKAYLDDLLIKIDLPE